MRVVQKAFTFDDVLLVPAHSTVLPRDVSLKTRLTRTITLNIPLVSAAMDTVTEARLAIAIAQEGGIGIVHKNMTIAAQAGEVSKVKRFESGVVKDPITITQNMTVRDVLQLTQQHRISGLPVIDSAGRVVGIVTNRDLRFETNLGQPVKNIAGGGVPQITAVQNVASALEKLDIPLIADGGIRFSGDIAKALAAGGHAVMIGGLFAGTEEAPGEIELYQGRSYKSYRGMGSLGAMQQGAADR